MTRLRDMSGVDSAPKRTLLRTLRRLETLPGLTGLWQVSGRSELGFSEQVLMDIMYIENWSLGLDLRILLRTVPTVLSGKGAF